MGQDTVNNLAVESKSLGPIIFVPVMSNYGGIERNLIALSEYFHLQGTVATILCFWCRFDIENYATHHLNIVQLSDSSNPFTRAWLLSSYLEKQYRVNGMMPLLFGIKAAFYMGIRCKSPFALHYTDPPSLLSGERIPGIAGAVRRFGANFLTARGVRRASVFLTMTSRNADELERLYTRRPNVVFQGGRVLTEPIEKRRDGAAIRVFSVCRLEASKRIDWIIKGVRKFNATTAAPQAVAVIAGTGSEESRLREQYATGPEVEILGALSEAQLGEQWRLADVFAVSALQGYGLTALEALYRDIPTVVHTDSGVSEVLDDERLAIVVAGDEGMFVDAIVEAINRYAKNGFPEKHTSQLPSEDGWARGVANRCEWRR